jgi:hypothetical protein
MMDQVKADASGDDCHAGSPQSPVTIDLMYDLALTPESVLTEDILNDWDQAPESVLTDDVLDDVPPEPPVECTTSGCTTTRTMRVLTDEPTKKSLHRFILRMHYARKNRMFF